ncbi:hypothetical protein HU200_028963 [Digitaria exilis]|uniref:Uncharacterized protein n=1 Tax=Digitaria exilis TaxID=1010633 RepID=A0A835BZN0_9POAL|nr:hypothetical protein HU200_028963 [Digitaria exilis]
MSCLLSETILSVNEIKLFVSDKNNKLHSAMRTVSQSKQKGKVARALKEHRARLYIIRRCIVMLLCWHD